MSSVVNGLWIQGNLSSLETLTIKSFIANGYTFQLWTYEPHSINAPENTVIKNAAEIIPFEHVFKYDNRNIHGHGKGSYAGFSDIFRYKLLYEHGGIWTDMDITCLKAIDIKDDYFFRFHLHAGAVGNFMKCPKNSDLMKWCYDEASKKVTKDNKNWMLPIQVLNEGIRNNNLEKYIHHFSNNDSFPEVIHLLSSDTELPEDWLVIHWMNEEWRRFNLEKNMALTDSVYYKLLMKHDIPVEKSNLFSRWTYRLKVNRFYYLLMSVYSIYKYKLLGSK